MSTLSMFIEEGKKEAVKEAVEKTTIKRDIQITQKMHKNGFSNKQISKILGRDEKFVLEAIKAIK